MLSKTFFLLSIFASQLDGICDKKIEYTLEVVFQKKNQQKIAPNKKKILVASPVCRKPNILKEFLISLTEQSRDKIALDYAFIDDNNEVQASEILLEFVKKVDAANVILFKNTGKISDFFCDEVRHHWTHEAVWKVAWFKDQIIKYARGQQYDYLFLIDSDIVMHPRTIEHLVSCNKDIISEIFWTKWSESEFPLPQVWLYDHYTQHEVDIDEILTPMEASKRFWDFIVMLEKPGVYEVGGLGACTLISRNALDKDVSFARIKNITFSGEDRHFCVRAVALGFSLFVDTHYQAYHIYREGHLSGVENYKKSWKDIR